MRPVGLFLTIVMTSNSDLQPLGVPPKLIFNSIWVSPNIKISLMESKSSHKMTLTTPISFSSTTGMTSQDDHPPLGILPNLILNLKKLSCWKKQWPNLNKNFFLSNSTNFNLCKNVVDPSFQQHKDMISFCGYHLFPKQDQRSRGSDFN